VEGWGEETAAHFGAGIGMGKEKKRLKKISN